LADAGVENSVDKGVIRKKEKVGKKKEGDPPYGKVENAKGRVSHFPTGPAAGEKRRRRKRRIDKEGGFAANILTEFRVACL
jgi:hypothetical protein